MRADDPLAVAIRKQTGNNVCIWVGEQLFVLKSWTLKDQRLDTAWEPASVVTHSVLEEKHSYIQWLRGALVVEKARNDG